MLSSQDQRQDKMATLITSNQQGTTQLKRQGEVRTRESEVLGDCQIKSVIASCLGSFLYERKIKGEVNS